MTGALLRTDKEITEIFERHSKILYRVCYSYMKNTADTEDVVQDAFYNLIVSQKSFENYEHELAWLIRTATNLCKNKLKHWWRKREELQDDENLATYDASPDNEVLSAVLRLPDKYKTAIYLYYYEGYNSEEIAKILKKPSSTIRNHLSEAKEMLRGIIEEDEE